jgi:amidophosphoribosyltransferase
MLTTNPYDDDKLREECGVFGIWGAETASAITALGLHALQHRGQEAAGITSYDGRQFHSHRAQGHVAGNFDRDDIIRSLAGQAAIGHVRYSTTGETALRNVQPLFAELSSGGFAVSHNGNISNALRMRRELNRRGSIFQSTSDTEVIIHLVATSSYRTLLDRFIDALKQVEGAYSLVCLTSEGMLACRDPLGIRPLVMGRLGDAYIFASRDGGTGRGRCDLYPHRRAGRARRRFRQGHTHAPPVRAGAAAAVHIRTCLFRAARQHRRRLVRLRSEEAHRSRVGRARIR